MAKGKRVSKIESRGDVTIPEIPIRITIEVIVRQESAPVAPQAGAFKATLGEECPDNKFSYTITQEQANIKLLSVESFSTDNPGESGNFTACVNDPSPEPRVRVISVGTQLNPGGHASLNLKFNGRNLTSTPIEYEHGDNGILSIHQLIKLPLS